MDIKMQDIGKRIKARRTELGFTQTDIYRACGIASGALSQIEQGHRTPSILIFYTLSQVLKCSMEWLVTGKSSCAENTNKIKNFGKEERLLYYFRKLSEEEQLDIQEYTEFKLYKLENEKPTDHPIPEDLPVIGYVAAGQPILAIENPLSFTSRINQLVNYALYIKGDSMEPVIKAGETVQVISQKTLENGEIGIIKVDDSATCKRFYRDGHSVKLVSFNPAYEPLIFDSTSSNEVQILGKVVLTDGQNARLEDWLVK